MCNSGITIAQDVIFSVDEVRKDAREYIRIVFGSREPTLSDYARFDTWNGEEEMTFELQLCARLFPGVDPDHSSDCGRVLAQRHQQPHESKSLYYSFLRAKLKVNPSTARIEEISTRREREAGYRVRVFIPESNTYIILGHSKLRELAPLGLVGILEVNGQPLERVIAGK